MFLLLLFFSVLDRRSSLGQLSSAWITFQDESQAEYAVCWMNPRDSDGREAKCFKPYSSHICNTIVRRKLKCISSSSSYCRRNRKARKFRSSTDGEHHRRCLQKWWILTGSPVITMATTMTTITTLPDWSVSGNEDKNFHELMRTLFHPFLKIIAVQESLLYIQSVCIH